MLAKGKYAKPKTVWNSKFFNERFREIDDFENRIEAVVADLKRQEGIRRLAKALSSPIANIPQLGLLGHLFPSPTIQAISVLA